MTPARLRLAAGILAVGALSGACATVPVGPSLAALPGRSQGFDQFQQDDGVCRQWALQQAGVTPQYAAVDTTVAGAAIGTLIGAALGAAIGAAAGNPAAGAAIGAGSGLFGGTVIGASEGYAAGASVQQRYDAAYFQCMYAKGHQVPVRRGARPAYASPPPPPPAPPPPPPAASALPPGIPPPPAGTPPPAPPGPTR